MGTSLNGLTPAGTYPGLIKTGDNAPIDGTLKTLSDGNGNNLPMSVSTTTINLTGTAQVGGVAIANTTQLAAKQDTLVSGTNIKTINGTSVLGSGNIVTPTTSPSGVAGAIQFSDGSAFASDAANLFWDDTNNRLGVGTNAPTAILQAENSTNGVLLARFKDALASTSYIDIKADSSLTDYTALYFGSDRRIMSKQGGALFLTCTNSVRFVDGLSTSMTITPTEFQIGSISGARVGIKGSGSTSATTSLLVQNSAGTAILTVRDGGADKQVLMNSALIGSLDMSGSIVQVGAGVNLIFRSANGVAFNSDYSSANASAQLDVSSTTKGFLPPRMTTTQRDAIATPATGLKVYNTTTNTTDTYDGTTWQRFGQQTLIKGSGSTSATTSLLVQNSAGTELMKVTDDGAVNIGGNTSIAKANLRILSGFEGSFNFGTINFSNWNGTVYSKMTGTNPANAKFIHGGTSIDASATMQIDSTTFGFLPPRMTTTQKNAIATPAAGLVVYDSTTNKLCCYNGSTWNDLF